MTSFGKLARDFRYTGGFDPFAEKCSEIADKLDRMNLQKRSLEELDDVIEEIIERNPEFVDQITEIVERSKNGL